jgi:hypothetical protein
LLSSTFSIFVLNSTMDFLMDKILDTVSCVHLCCFVPLINYWW